MWKWRELLPLPEGGEPVSLGEPETPMVPLPAPAGREPAGQGRGPAADRIVQGARAGDGGDHGEAFRVERIAMPTNGNAGAALAAYGARAGIETIVICPAETPEINIRETAAYGAEVYRRRRPDRRMRRAGRRRARRKGRWFDCSTLKEPYRLEGKKVMGLELAEQLGWELPDAIFYPTGGGTGLIGMWKAFDELERIGLIGPKRPRMYRGPGRRLRADRPRVRKWRRVRRALGRRGDHRDRHPRAQGGRRLPDPARGARERRRGDRGRGGGDLLPGGGRRCRARAWSTACCSARKAARCWPAGGGAGARAGRQGRAGAGLFNCANGNKYPLPDRSSG
jgi:threonine synthase